MKFFNINFSSDRSSDNVEPPKRTNKYEYPILKKVYKTNLKLEEKLIIGKIDETLKCKICDTLFLNPFSLSCGHIFCEACISKDSNCKICGKQIIEKKLNVKLQKRIEQMNMKCRYGYDFGTCTITFPTKDLLTHEDNCYSCWSTCQGTEINDKEVNGANSLKMGCHTSILTADKTSHFESCPYVRVKCTNKGCPLYVTRKNYDLHLRKHCSSLKK
eukprot:TRINITY_DN5232_c0_g1_i1.p1 TRINITY_DN5232_c0_g1~~TRINITY_DN5232_c0_g1_i1.p1  ORF type:complete len:216 (+),score=34.81 TRINITY_DN5232_c0_g1_i1:87-734(+)